MTSAEQGVGRNMAIIRVFSGIDVEDIGNGGTPNTADDFTISGGEITASSGSTADFAQISFIVVDNEGDDLLEGDSNTGNLSDDADQQVFIVDGGTVLANPEGFFLANSYTFTVVGDPNGLTYNAYELETEGGGDGIFVLGLSTTELGGELVPPPDGVADIQSRDFSPDLDSVATGPQGIDDALFYDNIFSGGEGANTDLFANYVNEASEADTIIGGIGDDTLDGEFFSDSISGGDGADSLTGGFGQDTLDGGAGDDTLIGDNGVEVINRQVLSWEDLPSPGNLGPTIQPGEDINSGQLVTEFITVEFDITDEGGFDFSEFDTTAIDTAGIDDDGNAVSANSSLQLGGDGTVGDVATFEFTFTPNDNALDEDVSNVSFNIVDIDNNTFIDQVTITAFDVDDNPIPIVLTAGGNLTLTDEDAGDASDDTAEATTAGNNAPDNPLNTLNVEIPGPVTRVVVDYNNEGGNNVQQIQISDIYFDVNISEDSAFADVIDGGDGDDSVDAGQGDDTITMADDDTVTGGDGADTFVITDDAGAGMTITDFDTATGIQGGSDPADQDDNDFADLSGFFSGRQEMVDAATSNAGDTTLDLGDGQTLLFEGVASVDELTFENTNVVCFARDTMIMTPSGERAVQDLAVGDEVVTRDNGVQTIRWAGRRVVPAKGALAPIVIRSGMVGNTRELRVSPLHRVLVEGWRAEMLFGVREVLVAAKHLLNGDTVYAEEGGEVEYHHILFDRHEIITANGAAAESLHPGKESVDGFGAEAREEIFSIFPELRDDPDAYGPAARSSLRAFEAHVLSANPSFLHS